MGVENYTLGRGIIYFNLKQANGDYLGEMDLGNAPEFSFSVAVDKLEHFSSRGGLKAKDAQVISQLTPSCKFTLDEINAYNLSLLTLAEIDPEVAATEIEATVTSETTRTVTPGHYVFLAKRGITAITSLKGSVTDVALVAGTDYDTLSAKDKELGRVFIKSTTTKVAAAGETLTADYTHLCPSYQNIKAFNNTTIEGILHYVSDNPVGNQTDIKMWSVSLTPSGDTSLIGTDWAQLSFEGEILKDEENHPDSPYFNIKVIE